MPALDILLDGPGPITAVEFRTLAIEQRRLANLCEMHGFPQAAESLRTLARRNDAQQLALACANESVETIAA
jgi:hypothetical protein